MAGVAGGKYKAILRGGRWVVRAPDGRVVETFGVGPIGEADATLRAQRLNEKLRPNEGE